MLWLLSSLTWGRLKIWLRIRIFRICFRGLITDKSIQISSWNSQSLGCSTGVLYTVISHQVVIRLKCMLWNYSWCLVAVVSRQVGIWICEIILGHFFHLDLVLRPILQHFVPLLFFEILNKRIQICLLPTDLCIPLSCRCFRFRWATCRIKSSILLRLIQHPLTCPNIFYNFLIFWIHCYLLYISLPLVRFRISIGLIIWYARCHVRWIFINTCVVHISNLGIKVRRTWSFLLFLFPTRTKDVSSAVHF